MVSTYSILCVAVSRADDASSFFDHLEDDAAVNVTHNIGVIWQHNPAAKQQTKCLNLVVICLH